MAVPQEGKSDEGCDCISNNILFYARVINLEHCTEKRTNFFIAVSVITLGNQNFTFPHFNTTGGILRHSGRARIENLRSNIGENVYWREFTVL